MKTQPTARSQFEPERDKAAHERYMWYRKRDLERIDDFPAAEIDPVFGSFCYGADWAFEWLKANATVVYTTDRDKWFFSERRYPTDKLQAYLIGIEEIKPKECSHINNIADIKEYTDSFVGVCANCGVKLKAKWITCD